VLVWMVWRVAEVGVSARVVLWWYDSVKGVDVGEAVVGV
jgi:hypothetical protein